MNEIEIKNRSPEFNNFPEKPYWVTADGQRMLMSKMKTSHLFNCFRMLYDGKAKEFGWPVLRKFRGLNNNPEWTDYFIVVNMLFLHAEMMRRADLTNRQKMEIAKVFEYLKITNANLKLERQMKRIGN
jgi:hypothetical protein